MLFAQLGGTELIFAHELVVAVRDCEHVSCAGVQGVCYCGSPSVCFEQQALAVGELHEWLWVPLA